MRNRLNRMVLCTAAFWLLCIPVFAQWDLVYDGSNDMGHVDLHFFDTDTGYVLGTSGTLGSYLLGTVDGGMNWDTTLFAPGDWCRSIDFPTRDTGYISFFNSFLINVYRTIDGGDSWIQVSSDIEVGSPMDLPIMFYDNTIGVLSTGGWSWFTANAGITWNQIITNPLGGAEAGFIEDSILVGAGSSYMMYHSIDTCTSFDTIRVFNDGTAESIEIKQLRITMAGMGQYGLAYGYPNVNFGQIALGDFPDLTFSVHHFPYMNGIRTAVKTDQYYYAGTAPTIAEQQFLKSEDGGLTWYTQSSTEPGGTSSVWINDMQCLNDTVCYALGAGGNIYKTTNGGGALVTQVGFPFTGVDELQVEGGRLNIWPNPSEGVFVVDLHGIRGNITLEVRDVMGRLVREQAVANGQSTLEIDLGNEPGGLYLVTLSTTDKIYGTKVMVR